MIITDNSVCVTGHRPDKLWGYDYSNDNWTKLSSTLTDICVELINDLGITTFISGGALGVDQIFFDVVWRLQAINYPHIKNILAMPFEAQDKVWIQESKDYFQKVKQRADKIVVVSEGDYSAWKLQKRNEWMVDNSGMVIAVWDGTSGGTGNCVGYAMKKNVPIIRVDPKEIK